MSELQEGQSVEEYCYMFNLVCIKVGTSTLVIHIIV